jgi:hypothetical protein
MTTGSDPQPISIGGQLLSKNPSVEAFTRRWYQIAVFPEPPLQRMLLFGLLQVVVGHEFILIVGD